MHTLTDLSHQENNYAAGEVDPLLRFYDTAIYESL